MIDQATKLRRLAASAEPFSNSRKRKPHVVAVTAGKGGVGTTTIAIGLAAALASEEQESLLVDGNFSNADVAAACGLAFDQRRTGGALGVVPWGPAGMHVAVRASTDLQSLVEQIQAAAFDVVVVDAGSGLNRSVRELWRAADQIVLITGEEVIAAMDAYAAVKLMAPDCPQPISTVVNGTQSADVADEIHARIAGACHRFLGRELHAGGFIPRDPKLARRAANLRIGWPEDSTDHALLRFRQLAHHTTRVANGTRRLASFGDEFREQLASAAA